MYMYLLRYFNDNNYKKLVTNKSKIFIKQKMFLKIVVIEYSISSIWFKLLNTPKLKLSNFY